VGAIKQLRHSIVKTLANALVETVGDINYNSEMRDSNHVSADWDDYFTPRIEKSIYNARLCAEEPPLYGIINNLLDKVVINIQLIDEQEKLKDLDLKKVLNWLNKIDVHQLAKDIYSNGMIEGESFIRLAIFNDEYLTNYIQPIFLEVNNVDHFMKKIRDDNLQIEKYIHYFPKKEVKLSAHFQEIETKKEEKYETEEYTPNDLLNPMYNQRNGKPRSPVMACMDDLYFIKDYEIEQAVVTHRDNVIIVSSQLDSENQPIIPNIPLEVQENIATQFSDESKDGVVFVEGGIATSRISQNKTIDYDPKIARHEKKIINTMQSLPSQAGSEISNVSSLQVIAESEVTGWVLTLRGIRTWILRTLNRILNRHLLLIDIEPTDIYLNFADITFDKKDKESGTMTEYEPRGYIVGKGIDNEIRRMAEFRKNVT